jgi:hypothetical protein
MESKDRNFEFKVYYKVDRQLLMQDLTDPPSAPEWVCSFPTTQPALGKVAILYGSSAVPLNFSHILRKYATRQGEIWGMNRRRL